MLLRRASGCCPPGSNIALTQIRRPNRDRQSVVALRPASSPSIISNADLNVLIRTSSCAGDSELPIRATQEPSVYESTAAQVASDSKYPSKAIEDRLDELEHEKDILQHKRRKAIRAGDASWRDRIDERLNELRQEMNSLMEAMNTAGRTVNIRDYRDREENREEEFLKIFAGQKRVTNVLEAEGEMEIAEHARALYAQDMARLFGAGEDTYT